MSNGDSEMPSAGQPAEGDAPDKREPRPGLTERLTAAGTEYNELPGVHVTVNQIVAYNMARYRKAAGLTQEELADRLAGWTPKRWSKAAVSAAERSWDGKRVRQFDADLLFGLALAFGLPITAFFLPPADDGVERRYLIDATYGGNWAGCQEMVDLLNYAMSDPVGEGEREDEGTEYMAMRDYQARLTAAIDFHFGAGVAELSFRSVDDLNDEQQVIYRLEKIRGQYDALRGIMGDLGKTHDHLVDRLVELKGPELEADNKARNDRIRKQAAEMKQRDDEIERRYIEGQPIEKIARDLELREHFVKVGLVRAKLLPQEVLDEAP